MIIFKTPEEIDRMAAAGALLVRTMSLLQGKIRPGVTTQELDSAAERFIRSQGAEPAFKGYRGFPGSICASPNSMIVHGIPGPYELSRGDILSVDIGVVLDGWVADAARTLGDRFDLQALHDYLWINGNVPIALLRWELLGLDDELELIGVTGNE